MTKPQRSPCPIACILDLIGDRWTLLVVRDLACGKQYFGEFVRSPEGMATNILTDRLEKLVANGFVEKVPGDAGRDAYRLTKKGKSLRPVMAALKTWGLKNIEGTETRLTPSFR